MSAQSTHGRTSQALKLTVKRTRHALIQAWSGDLATHEARLIRALRSSTQSYKSSALAGETQQKRTANNPTE